MTVLDEFYESHLHYSVSQRLFEDRCRQLIGFKGNVDERQALVDETLRLAICVSDNIDDTEGLIPDVLDHLRDTGGDPDLVQAISFIANNLKEDRARANSYSNFVTYRRIGNRTRKPRRPQVANPFIPIVEDDDDGPVEAIVIPPKDGVIRMTVDDSDDEGETEEEPIEEESETVEEGEESDSEEPVDDASEDAFDDSEDGEKDP